MAEIIECDRIPERGKWFIAAEKQDFLVIAKGSGLPSAPLEGGSFSVFEAVASEYPDVLSVSGKTAGEGGLIHRIDTETCGLLLIARKDTFSRHIEECRKAGIFVKEYTAYSLSNDGRLPSNQVITSRFRPFGKKGAAVKPVFEDDRSSTADKKKAGSRLYSTEVVESAVVSTENGGIQFGGKQLVRIVCRINEGFRHQVRSHLAYSGFPIFGDMIYGRVDSDRAPETHGDMLFFASGLSFTKKDGTPFHVRIPYSLLDKKALSVCLTSLTR